MARLRYGMRWLAAAALLVCTGLSAWAGPLHDAVRQRNIDEVERLLANGADAKAVEGGETPLHIAARRGSGQLVKALAKAGGDPNAASGFGVTPLHIACTEAGTVEVVKALLAAGANPRQADNSGDTAFDYAARDRRDDLVEVLRAAD